MKSRTAVFLLAVLLSIVSFVSTPHARDSWTANFPQSGQNRPSGVLVMDGSTVHDVGNLLFHISNWGMAGSMPGSGMPFSLAPSAEWPAGSGVEHLFAAGLWVGGVKGGVPGVSTAAYEFEFRPTEDPIDIMYSAREGVRGGIRYPFPGADDDGDGMVDEDPLDGWDNNGDGMVDEDFAAISDQMLTCWYTDDQLTAIQQYPQHNPLDLTVRQRSFQWSDEGFDDFVGVEYMITNTGSEALEDVYIGIFADCDVGRRDTPGYWQDDATGFFHSPVVCTPLGAVGIDMAYTYDADGDGGATPSYFGIVVLDHPTDPDGIVAPARVGVATYATFAGDLPYEEGGDPANDFERYELMSRQSIDRNATTPRDYRTLLALGPFASIPPESTMVVRIAFVAGEGLTGLIQNAARARLAFRGKWFDIDANPLTGVDGRETPVYGPAEDVVIDACRPGLDEPVDVPEGEVLWINADCEEEVFRASACRYGAGDSVLYRTGVAGKETNVHWTIGGREPQVTRIAVMDIKPGSYPNPFNVKFFALDEGDDDGHAGSRGKHMKGKKERKGGVLPVAILGRENFPVEEIDLATVRLSGVEPLDFGMGYEDLGSPTGGTTCPFTSQERDGYTDLMLKFRTAEIAAAISPNGEAPDVPEMQLMMTGKLVDGTPFKAFDCIVFVGKGREHDDEDEGEDEREDDGPALRQPYPNPFNPVTRISYYLPEESHVRLAVYDVSGKLLEVLQDGVQPAGEHTLVWNGSGLASGIYFYKLQAGKRVVVRKAVLVK